MDLDGPKKSESMSMDVDDGVVSPRCSPRRESVGMDSPGRGCIPSPPFHDHPLFRREYPPGAPPVNYVEETGETSRGYGLAQHHRDILPSSRPSIPEVTRKRKHADDASHVTEDDGGCTNSAQSQSHRRRVRPRLQTRRDAEFSPLLIMSPGREQDLPAEETALAFHYPPGAADTSRSIRRYFDLGPAHEHDPLLQRSSSPRANDLEDPQERRRSDSADSFAQVALASTAAPKRGRLSTLQDFWLPRPFEDSERRSLGGIVVHERGLDAGPLFLSAKSGRADGPLASCEPEGSLRSAMPTLQVEPIRYFDKPLCESPDSIHYEDGSGHNDSAPGDIR